MEGSAKSYENWTVGLKERTATMLEQWLVERDAYPIYGDSESLWLTREWNLYGSEALKHVLMRLYAIAGIERNRAV